MIVAAIFSVAACLLVQTVVVVWLETLAADREDARERRSEARMDIHAQAAAASLEAHKQSARRLRLESDFLQSEAARIVVVRVEDARESLVSSKEAAKS